MANGLQHRARSAAAAAWLGLCLLAGPAGAAPVAPGAEPAVPGTEAAAAAAPVEAEVQPAAGPADPEMQPTVGTAANVGPVERLAQAFERTRFDEPLEPRVERVRAEASRMGMWSAEPAAQGLLLADGLGSPAERAAAAVRLAPGLPAAWGALAVAQPGWASLPALGRGLLEMERNLDASVWWRATALRVLVWALVAGGVLFLVTSAVRLAPAGAHDLAHRLPGRLPPHLFAALLACLGVLPAAAGEGLVGVAAGAFLVALPWAGARHRGALVAALAGVLAAVHPVTDETGRWIEALRADPATVAIRNAEVSGLSPAERARLERLAPRDPAAGHALVLWSKRHDRLDLAARWLEVAGAEASAHPVLLNDAANVRLAEGDSRAAIRLYEQASESQGDAAVLFNLAQVYGSQIDLTRQQLALEAAQSLSAATVQELSDLRGNGRLAVDLPWPVADLRGRLARAADGRAVAGTLRAPFGAGRLVGDPLPAVAVLGALGFVALLVGRGRSSSRVCALCGARRCEACPRARGAGSCPSCQGAQAAAPPLHALRKAVVALLLRGVPGFAGVAAERPWLAWLAALCAGVAVAAYRLREGVVPDPLAAGLAGQAAFLLAALASALLCALVTSFTLRSRP